MQTIMRSTVTVSLLGALLLTLPALGNNIQVENFDIYNQDTGAKTITVEFDLSWDNSWRNDLNHDAAWVFVKFRAPGSNHWEHAYLSSNNVDHRAPGGLVEVGTSALGATTNAVGAFITSANNRTGTVNYARTRLAWDYGASGYDWPPGEEIDVSVQAIEMVYVDEGSFYVGSGGRSTGELTDGAWVGSGLSATIPFFIDSEDALMVTNAPGGLWSEGVSSDGGYAYMDDPGILPAAFPKGYGAFYCMKYEITQDQYVDFLNLLSFAQQDNLILGSPDDAAGTFTVTSEPFRHAIYIAESGTDPDTNAVYATTNAYVACSYVTYLHGAAYAQWAGLRPMTELEYEKACRGPAQPVAYEYAWGSTSYELTGSLAAGNYSDLGLATENVSLGNVICEGGASSPAGPARVGIFANNSSNRVETGASYWGIMELSGNLFERPVRVDMAAGRAFEGSHGDGTLSDAGYATRPDWPGYDSGEVTSGTGVHLRGGSWGFGVEHSRVGWRWGIKWPTTYRGYRRGFRGVRTAP